MIDAVHLGGICIDSFLAVEDQRVRLDAILQFTGDLQEFLGAHIAFVVVHH